ncbi:MAG TPA: UDP-N-acetylmuramoyl-L-alanyl-D-glutamate--2,6-diaminopimelate ligase [Clostridia bacterium]|nr:UDP-N-acetylmuramoyl-L-alanyl-D-glutamate--2,6-diaminopimelate ligase [Clostridia bacterium]
MNLNNLLEGVDLIEIIGDSTIEVTGLAYDSRQVKPGNIFVCIKGFKSDGHNYIADACRRGAVGVVVERTVDDLDGLTVIKVPDSRLALAQLAVRFYNFPSQSLGLIGVTGTNGKTTTTYLIESILQENGKKTGLIGTIANKIGNKSFAVEHTTPESLDLQQFLKKMVKEQVEWAVMEVSSHALSLHRVDETYYDLAVFTNLTQDHLDFHLDFDNYLEAKLKLFRMLKKGPKGKTAKAVINLDDFYGKDFIQAAEGLDIITYGINSSAQVKAKEIKITSKGVTFTLVSREWTDKIKLNTPGLFSVYNALAAISVGLALNIPREKIIAGLSKVKGVPGRFESIDCGQDFGVIVDYAHTPDGLENILQTAKQFAQRKIILVFGCGGDRDKKKRPQMGQIALRYADKCIITSDNPRSEDPLAIIEDILTGIRGIKEFEGKYTVIPDRKEAIFYAISEAEKDDLVIIAGKGHENYQILKDKTIHFDDREVAREVLKGGKK